MLIRRTVRSVGRNLNWNFLNLKTQRMKKSGLLQFSFLFFFLLIFSAFAMAQQKISGRVLNAGGEPIPGASVKIKGTTRGTTTGTDGVFNISASEADVLQISALDYVPTQVVVGTSTQLSITLIADAKKMDEVVVVAFGTKQKSTLIESVAQVDEKVIKNRPVNNAVSALQGQVAGLNIVSYSGQPGVSPTINIRGVGSINSSTAPLVIVDGVPGSLSLIDPNDIASISVLKDASAASLYGARAANGVILVTTKTGKVGKITVSYSGYVGWQQPTELFKEANAYNYANSFNEATMYDLIKPASTNFDSSKIIFTQPQLDGWKSGQVPSTNWRKTLFDGNNGFTQSHYINIGGGINHDDLTLRNNFSFGYLQQNGNLANTNYKRFSIRSNSELKWKQLSTNLSVGLITDNRYEPSSKAVGNLGAIISAVNRQRPVDSIKLSDGSWNITSTNDTRNPVRQAVEGGYYNPINYNILLNFNTAYTIVKDLTLKYTVGLSYNINSASQFQNQLSWYNNTVTGPNNSTKSNYTDRENLQQVDLTYSKNIQKHHVDVIVGGQQNIHNYISTTLSRGNFINNSSNGMQLGDPSTQTNSSTEYKWILEGLYGRLNYDFDRKYLLEFNAREDVSSRLNPATNTDFFPSAAAGWRVSQENFWGKMKDILPEFKVRASYGTLGNANVATSTGNNNAMFYSYNSIIGNVYSNGLGYNLASVFDGTIYNAFSLVQNPNNKLRWERTTIADVAIEGTILSPRLTYTIDYFNKTTNRMLLQYPVSDVNGVTSQVGVGASPQYPANLGSMYNRGLEVSFGYSGQNKNGFGYSLNANYTYITSKILNLGGLNLASTNSLAVGYPLSAFYLYANDGYLTKDEFVAQASKDPILKGQKWGDQRIIDMTGDGKITAADRMMINKTSVPKHLFGLNFDFNYKGIGIAGMVQGAADYYKYLGASVGYGFNSGYSITNWSIENAYNPLVDPNNYNTRLPRVSISNTINNTYPSTLFLFNSSYVRLKNLQVYYDLPGGALQKVAMKSARIYLSGQNLLTFSKLPTALGIDPEINSATAGYPLVAIYTIGLNVSF
jgi:TonB-linked SusC/RagA family outer membrane protein